MLYHFKTCLCLILITSAFITKAQEQEKNIPSLSPLIKHVSKSVKADDGIRFQTIEKNQQSALCSCFVQTQINPVSRTGTLWTYQGSPSASCFGEIITTPGPSMDTCGIAQLNYSWSVTSGSNVVEISGSNTGSTVNLLIKGNGPFTLSLVNTVTCTDGSTCTAFAYYTDTARGCTGCTCNITTAIRPGTGTDSLRGYFGVVNGNCTGNFKKSSVSQDCDSCGPMKNITYQWSIVGGNDVAQIVGPNNQQFVQVKIIKAGGYFLQLTGTGQCQDDRSCSETAVIRDSLSCTGCKCKVEDVGVIPKNRTGNIFNYNGTFASSCTGAYRSGPVDCVTCTRPVSHTFKWTISSGSDVAAINGPDNQQSVQVLVKKEGRFTVRFQVTVTCEDSTKCTDVAIYQEEIPCDKCSCDSVTATITRAVQEDPFSVQVRGVVTGNCTGRHELGADCVDCSTADIQYKWSISVGNEFAQIAGPDDEPIVEVLFGRCGLIVMKLLGTVICSDGTQCTAADIIEIPVGRACFCGAFPEIKEPSKRGNIWTYNSELTSNCAGDFDPPDCKKCDVSQKKYLWDVFPPRIVEIVGPNNTSSVNVRILRPGTFTVSLNGTTICNDKTECSDEVFRDDTIPSAGFCVDSSRMTAVTAMNGGLMPQFKGTQQIKLGELIPLGAAARDFDLLKFFCVPSGFCDDSRSERDVTVNGRVRFEWSVITGAGRFVRISGGQERQFDSGNIVLFKPPLIPIPASNENATIVTTTLRLTIIDDNPNDAIDAPVVRQITITMIRRRNPSDRIMVVISSPDYILPSLPTAIVAAGSCRAGTPTWTVDSSLVSPMIMIPDEAGTRTLRAGTSMILRVPDHRDPDELSIRCNSAECPGTLFSRVFEDNVHWQWNIAMPGNAGRLIQASEGRFVVYQAPEQLPGNLNHMDVRIRSRIMNPDNRMIKDINPAPGDIVIRITR